MNIDLRQYFFRAVNNSAKKGEQFSFSFGSDSPGQKTVTVIRRKKRFLFSRVGSKRSCIILGNLSQKTKETVFLSFGFNLAH